MRAALVVLALSGCVAVWGRPYKIEFADSSLIMITFDPTLTNMGELEVVAEQECAKYGKEAVPGTWQNSPWALRTMSYSCQKKN